MQSFRIQVLKAPCLLRLVSTSFESLAKKIVSLWDSSFSEAKTTSYLWFVCSLVGVPGELLLFFSLDVPDIDRVQDIVSKHNFLILIVILISNRMCGL